MSMHYVCDYCGMPIDDDDHRATYRVSGRFENADGKEIWSIYGSDVGHYHGQSMNGQPSCESRIFDAIRAAEKAGRGPASIAALEAIPTRGESPEVEEKPQPAPRPVPSARVNATRKKTEEELQHEQEWAEHHRRQDEWRRKSWELREALLLDVLEDRRLTVGELAAGLNAKLGWPTGPSEWHHPLTYPPIGPNDVRPVAMRLLERGVLDRVHGPYRHMAAVWHFYRRGLDGPIADLERAYNDDDGARRLEEGRP